MNGTPLEKGSKLEELVTNISALSCVIRKLEEQLC